MKDSYGTQHVITAHVRQVNLEQEQVGVSMAQGGWQVQCPEKAVTETLRLSRQEASLVLSYKVGVFPLILA